MPGRCNTVPHRHLLMTPVSICGVCCPVLPLHLQASLHLEPPVTCTTATTTCRYEGPASPTYHAQPSGNSMTSATPSSSHARDPSGQTHSPGSTRAAGSGGQPSPAALSNSQRWSPRMCAPAAAEQTAQQHFGQPSGAVAAAAFSSEVGRSSAEKAAAAAAAAAATAAASAAAAQKVSSHQPPPSSHPTGM